MSVKSLLGLDSVSVDGTTITGNGTPEDPLVATGGGGSGSPAGSNTQVQFNNGGAFGASADFTWDGTTLSASNFAGNGSGLTDIDHNGLTSLTIGDVHTQYALLAGRATAQGFAFGTSAGATAGYLTSTSHATKGRYSLNAAGTMIVDELNGRIGIGGVPAELLTISGVTSYGNGMRMTGSNATGIGFAIENTISSGRQWRIFSAGASANPGVGGLGIYDQTGGAYGMWIDTSYNVTAPAFKVATQSGIMKVGTYGTVSETNGGQAYITGNNIRASTSVNNQVEKYTAGAQAGQFFRMRYDTGISIHTGIGSGDAAGTQYADTVNQRMLVDLNGNVAIGSHTTISAKLHIINTTEQFRSGYDTSNYAKFTTNSTGSLTLDLVGTSPIFRFAETIAPDASDGSALGNTTLMWSDLFLASGGVINFNNGNATLTHSAGLITSNVDIEVPTETYGASWATKAEAATKLDLYAKIQTMSAGSGITIGQALMLGSTF